MADRSNKEMSSCHPLRSIATRLILVICSIVTTLCLVEVLLRLTPGLLPEAARTYARRQNEAGWRIGTLPHPYVGYLFPANTETIVRSSYASFTYGTDAFGFRNSQPWPRRAEIVALGDSITFGYGVDEDKAWTHLVQKSLHGSRIVNLGLPGAAPQQYLRIYETYGIALRPKVLLVGLFPGNDLKDAAEFNAWLSSGAGGNYDLWRSFRVASPGVQYLLAGLLKRSYLFAFLNMLRASGAAYGGGVRTISFEDGSRLSLVPGLIEDLAQRARPEKQEFRLVMQTLERLQSLAREHGTTPVVLLLPMKEEIYLPLLGKERDFDPSASIREALNVRSINYLDLAPHFRRPAAMGQRLFFEGWHPNTSGYALIAEIVLSHLKENARSYGLKDWDAEFPGRHL
jgi:lysophospholipase L1-like esterase